MEENTEKRVDLTLFSEKIQALKDRIATVIVGQEQIVDLVLTAVWQTAMCCWRECRGWQRHCLPVWWHA